MTIGLPPYQVSRPQRRRGGWANGKGITRSAVAVVGTTFLFAACGSSGSSSTAATTGSTGSTTISGSTGSTTGAPTGAPIKIMLEDTVTASAGAFPEGISGAKAAIGAVNDAGGINGHQVTYVVCDDQENPNLAAACARTAVQDKVAAVVVAGLTEEVASMIPVLQAAGIPLYDPSPDDPGETAAPDVFALAAGGDAGIVSTAQFMKIEGCKQPGAVSMSDISETLQFASDLAKAVPLAGYTVPLKQSHITLSTTDMSSAVLSLASDNVDCGVQITTSTGAVGLLTAAHQQAPNIRWFTTLLNYTASTLAKIPTADSNSLYLYSPINTTESSDSYPEEVTFKAQMAKYAAGAAVDDFSLGSWAACKVLFAALKTETGTIDAANTIAATKALNLPGSWDGSPYSTAVFGPIDFAKPLGVAGQPYLYSANEYLYRVQDGKVVLAQSAPINAALGY